MFGSVNISRSNVNLLDQSNREGIVETQEFKALREALTKIIHLFEMDRQYVFRKLRSYNEIIDESERIEKEIQKTREKITEYQNKLRGLEAQKTEAENLQIVQLVRSMRLTPQELTAMLSGNGIPGIAPIPADYEEQEDNADEE